MNIDQRLRHDEEQIKHALSELKHEEEPDMFHKDSPIKRLRKASTRAIIAGLTILAASGILPSKIQAQAQHASQDFQHGKMPEKELIEKTSLIYIEMEKEILGHARTWNLSKAMKMLDVYLAVTEHTDPELHNKLLALQEKINSHLFSKLAERGERAHVYGTDFIILVVPTGQKESPKKLAETYLGMWFNNNTSGNFSFNLKKCVTFGGQGHNVYDIIVVGSVKTKDGEDLIKIRYQDNQYPRGKVSFRDYHP